MRCSAHNLKVLRFSSSRLKWPLDTAQIKIILIYEIKIQHRKPIIQSYMRQEAAIREPGLLAYMAHKGTSYVGFGQSSCVFSYYDTGASLGY